MGQPQEARNKIAQEIWKLDADQVWQIGIVGMSPAYMGTRVVNAKLENVPERTCTSQHCRTPWSGRRRRCRRRWSCCRRLLWRATVRILPLSTLLLDILVVLQGPAAQHKAATGSEIQPDRPRASVIQIGSISAGCLRRKNLGASRPNLEFGSRRFVVAARQAGTGKAMLSAG